MVKRELSEQKFHDRAVVDIAKARFSYKNGTKTYTNPGSEKNYGINDLYPDIVAVKDTSVVAIGEVETKSTVTPEEAEEQWKLYGLKVKYFYLYVPKEKVSTAKEIIQQKQIDLKGLRAYFYDKEGNIHIQNIPLG